MKSNFCLLLLAFFMATNPIKAQFFAEGGFDFAYIPLKETNRLFDQFNAREAHNLSGINTMSGYHVGFGKYSNFTVMGIGFGNIFTKQISKNPALLKETVEFAVNMSSVDVSLGIKPFKRQFHTFGASLHMGQLRYRYSFGGDYIVPLTRYSIGGEFFIDLAFKFRFLIKKELREKNFYIFRIRPYYKLNQSIDLYPVQQAFNEDATVQFGDIVESLNHFGIRASLTIPFLNKDEQEKYKLGGTADNERLRLRQEKQMERMNKKHSPDVPRGRL